MAEALSKWFHFRARFTRHQDERNTLLAERSEGWSGRLVGIGRAVQERPIQVCIDDQIGHSLVPLPVMEIIDCARFGSGHQSAFQELFREIGCAESEGNRSGQHDSSPGNAESHDDDVLGNAKLF